jgi:preprotein translocase subunit SecY
MPYISSIVVQLMELRFLICKKLKVRVVEKINQITRWLTIVITLVQGPTYIYNLYRTLPSSAFLLGFNSFEFLFSSVIILVTIFAMWLGEKITDKGIGNGISLLIMVGILARFPQAFIQEFTTRVTTTVVQCYWLSKLLFGF